MKHRIFQWVAILCCVLVFITIFFVCLDVIAFDRNFYKQEYAKLQVAESIPMSEEDLEKTTDVLLGYLQGKYETLEVTAEVAGQERQVFNEREIAHMVDVKALYEGARTVAILGGILFAAMVVAGIAIYRRKFLPLFSKSFLWAGGIFLAIIVVILLLAVVDFSSFWTTFHKIFFRNQLWILDPSTDILIMMVPSQFFFDLVTKIGIWYFGIMAVLTVGMIVVRRICVKKQRKGSMPSAERN